MTNHTFDIYDIAGLTSKGLTAGARDVVTCVYESLNARTGLRDQVFSILVQGYHSDEARGWIAEAGTFLRTLDDGMKAYNVLVSTVSQVTNRDRNDQWPADLPQLGLQKDAKGNCIITAAKKRKSAPKKANVMTKALAAQAERLHEQVKQERDVTGVVLEFIQTVGLTPDQLIEIAESL